jgi:endoglucanase
MQRRDFLKTAAIGATAVMAGRSVTAAEATAAQLSRKLPRWRGFNLLEKFQQGSNAPFVEADFQWIADWGFDFVRLPMDYRCWTDAHDPYKVREKVLKEIDQAVAFGRKYGVHVCLNLHRAPGYTVAQPPEKLKLWSDEEAQKQFDFQWSMFANRYHGIPSTQLSFNLVNEPAIVAKTAYAKVVQRVVGAIRQVDPDRLIIADGVFWGRTPVFELVDLGIAQSTRGYEPMQITHYQASWVQGSDRWAKPTWPLKLGQSVYDRQRLEKGCIEPWKKLEAKGVGIIVGEWGAHNRTPHEAVLAWARDFLSLWKDAGWGWAVWNLRGSMGIVDSGRADITYEQFHGHKLDRKLLDLLREF